VAGGANGAFVAQPDVKPNPIKKTAVWGQRILERMEVFKWYLLELLNRSQQRKRRAKFPTPLLPLLSPVQFLLS